MHQPFQVPNLQTTAVLQTDRPPHSTGGPWFVLCEGHHHRQGQGARTSQMAIVPTCHRGLRVRIPGGCADLLQVIRQVAERGVSGLTASGRRKDWL